METLGTVGRGHWVVLLKTVFQGLHLTPKMNSRPLVQVKCIALRNLGTGGHDSPTSL